VNKKGNNIKGIIAGALFVVFVIVQLISAIKSYNTIDYSYSKASFFTVYLSSLIIWLLWLLFAISLFIDNLSFARVIRIVTLVYAAFTTVVTLVTGTSGWVISLLVSLLMQVMLLLAFIKPGKQGQIFGFISAGLFILSNLLSCIRLIKNYDLEFGFALRVYLLAPGTLLLLAALVMTAFYVADKDLEEKQAAPKAAAYVDPKSSLEKLTALKALLDKGAITSEEFEEKKKQLLGM